MSRSWLPQLIDELRPSDSRINLVIRALLSSAIAIVISQTLQVPWLALSLIAVFFITQSNIVITRAIGILFFVSSTLAIGAAILVLKFTYDYPMLRILLSSALFFLSVFLMRVTKVGVLFFLMALVVIYTQSFVDLTPQAEVVIRLVLWVWVAINYAILLTLIVNTLLLPAEPLKQLKSRMIAVLDETRAMLAQGDETRDLSAISQHATELHKLLRFSVMRSDRCRANEPGYLALITLVLQLNILAYQLPPAFGAAARQLAQKIDAACRALQTAISHDSALRFSVAMAGSDDPQVPAPLNEMATHLQVYANRSDYADALQAAPPPKVPFFTPDALTNPVYIQFSLKTLLTVLVAYVFYTAVDWSGIHTIMLSCLIVAQPSLGATQRRARLRLGGAAIGSLLALISVVWIMPHLDSLVGLLLLTLPVIALSAWIAAGSEKISYAGVQILFTFSLALLESFGPVTELTEIRDRLIGIVLGVGVATFIHATLWPEYEGESLRQQVANVLQALSHFLGGENTNAIGIWQKIEGCEAVVARVTLEPTWQLADDNHESFTRHIQLIFNQTRSLLLTSEKLNTYLTGSGAALSVQERAALLEVQRQGGRVLAEYAAQLASAPQALRAPDFHPPLAALHADTVRHLAQELSDGVNRLPAWGDA
ncbi:FUSC family protein [Serratia marcescens]|uniref:Membrane fusion component of tripartite multidrug resistance system n=1 Tax=Serratia marcescens TaxID=615 RepID=A0A345INN8_SERMA|nr:FUSC family protein [Serratia marcescens]AXH01460.1 Membrane fusion component of tripartite multidrug resistance system [Serratia marcescens]RFS90179.1 FUSC family protein [Serratia marcescens]